MSRPRVLFVHNAPITFVTQDLELLRERYDVTELHVRSDVENPLRTWRLVRDADLVFGWFASMHLLVPLLCARLLRRPSAVVLGGYDVAAEPELGYGHQLGGTRRLVARLVMRLATALLPVSEFNRRDAIDKAGAPARKLRLVPNGVPVPPAPPPGPRRTVLTVGRVDASNLERKGLRAFVETAALLPDVPFVLVGGGDPAVVERLRRDAPPNVVLPGQLSGQALVDRFTEAAVYVQASRYESFGLSVAEAMSYECIPVLTRLAALPEVGGDVAVYVDSPDAPALAEGVREAMRLRAADPARGAAARRRVEGLFPLELRGQRLVGVLEELLDKA
jgi:glycosyltransferase involved in cell wall biosynthesis